LFTFDQPNSTNIVYYFPGVPGTDTPGPNNINSKCKFTNEGSSGIAYRSKLTVTGGTKAGENSVTFADAKFYRDPLESGITLINVWHVTAAQIKEVAGPLYLNFTLTGEKNSTYTVSTSGPVTFEQRPFVLHHGPITRGGYNTYSYKCSSDTKVCSGDSTTLCNTQCTAFTPQDFCYLGTPYDFVTVYPFVASMHTDKTADKWQVLNCNVSPVTIVSQNPGETINYKLGISPAGLNSLFFRNNGNQLSTVDNKDNGTIITKDNEVESKWTWPNVVQF
jgi:hypothetical protein